MALCLSCTGFTEADCSALYQKAIRDNPTITLSIAKAMTIGPPQVGKTLLRHHLLGLPLPAISSSTPVMKTAETVRLCPMDEVGAVSSDEHSSDSEGIASSDDSDEGNASSDDSDDDLCKHVAGRSRFESLMFMASGKKWVRVNSASGILSLLTFLQEKMDDASTQSESRGLEVGYSEALVPVQSLSDVSVPAESLGAVASVVRHMTQQLQNPDLADVTLPGALLLQFLDCGGQLAYHDILPLFVNIPAIYLHVFNVTKELMKCPIDELCLPGGEKKYSAESAISVAEMITRSVMTVHSLTDKKIQLPSEVCVDKSSKPRVVLVGTHLDQLENDPDAQLAAINETLSKTLQSESHDLEGVLVKNRKNYRMFFPVSNLEVDRSRQSCMKNCTSERLKNRIRKQAEKDAVKVKVPVRWYLHQLLEMHQDAHEEKPLYSELYQRCKEDGFVTDAGDFHAMVTYFHALGLLVHLCGADVQHTEHSDCLVFTNPSFLFENISKLYRVQFEDDTTGDKIKLKHQGRLTKEALQELDVHIDHDRFMDLLVQLFIGAEIKSHNGDRILFVPSVLTNSPDDVTPSEVGIRPQKQSLCFAITFEGKNFIPCGVFTGMIARLQSTRGWNICTSSLSRMHMKFAVALGVINLMDYATHINVEIDGNEELNHGQYQVYRDTIIEATAESYCFLFHSKAANDSQSAICSMCTDSPFLVIGTTCNRCPPQPAGSRQVRHFAKLMVENCDPKSVLCPKLESVKPLDSVLEQVPFQNISHYVSDCFME